MASLTGFDASKVEPTKAFTPLPAGAYKVAITTSENKLNSKQNGTYLALELTVLDGEHKGRKLYENLNLKNPSQQAVEIARGTLSAICRAVNVLTPNDSAELHGKPMVAKVALEKRKDNGEMTNRVKAYKSLAEAAAEPVAAAATAAATEAPWN